MDDSRSAPPGTGNEASQVSWPAGPHYFDLTSSEGGIAWVRYRIWSADWHTRALNELAGVDRSFDRNVGIEMALDGALNSLSSAFDAGIALLIRAVETVREVDTADRLPGIRYKWERCRDMLKQADVANDDVWRLILDIDEAIEGEANPKPIGWLAQLRRLRNRVAHQDSLARHHELGGPSNIAGLSIDGQSIDAFQYLSRLCDRSHDLTEQMIRQAVAIGAREVFSTWGRERWNV